MKLILTIATILFVTSACVSRTEPPKTAPVAASKANVKIEESRILFGPASAPITIVKYADFQCPACAYDVKALEDVKAKYGDKVRIIHKNVPLEQIHPRARLAAEMFESLVQEDKTKARKFYELAYGTQRQWREEKDLWLVFTKVGGNKPKLLKLIKAGDVDKKIQEDLNEHEALGFRGTPAYVINGEMIEGAQDTETFSQIIDPILKK